MKSHLLVVGQGYVGLPLSIRAVEVGFNVVGLETNSSRVERLRQGDSFAEDVSDLRLKQALESGRFRLESSIDDCGLYDTVVITVPTPLRNGQPDVSFIESAAETIGPTIRSGALVILESTTYPGTTEEVMVPILERLSGLAAGIDFSVAYSPERIDPGNHSFTFVTTPKLVGGVNVSSLEVAVAFYSELIDCVVPVSSCKVAETAKLLENTFRHVNIALVNELAICAHQMGIDVWEVIDSAATKPFGFMRFAPGPGVGGHCLPIDPAYLAWRVKTSLNKPFRFVDLAMDVNASMPEYVVGRIAQALNKKQKSISAAKIVILGMAYKRNSADARESPAVEVVKALVELDGDVTIVDPVVVELPSSVRSVRFHQKVDDQVIADSDVVVLLTDHSAFDLDRISKHARYVFDTRRVFPPRSGVEYL